MSDTEKPPPEQPPSTSPSITTTKPSLPSIQSLFGIRREDDLDSLLPPPDAYPRSSEEYGGYSSPPSSAGTSHVRAQPQPPTTSPRPARPLRPAPSPFVTDAHPPSFARPTSSRRRTPESGSTDQPSRGQLLRRPSDASYHSPETPESAASSRMDPRMVLRQMHSPSSAGPSTSSWTASTPALSSTSTSFQYSAGFQSARSSSALQRADSSSSRSGRHGFEDAHGPPRTPRDSMSSMSSTASSFFGRPSVAHYQPGASSSSESISGHGADALKRRHTIGDDARIQGGAIRSSRSRTSRPTSPYNSSDRRRASPHASGFSGTSGGADSNFPSDRTLAHLPGLASQSESQLPTRSYPGPVSSYQEHRPTSRKRPTTSPTTSIQQAYPPSSFPRRLSASTSSLSGPSHVPPYTAAPSSYAMGGPSSYAGSAYGPPSGSAPYDHRGGPPQAYEQGRHRLYSASEVIGHFQVPFTEEVQPSSSGTGTGGERHKYECPFCYKGFNRPSSLKIHVNTHTGEKPFECSVPGCERRFSVMSNMRRHARTHDQARFMGDAVEVEDVEDDRESPTIEPRKRGGAASSPTSPHGLSSPAAGPSQPIESPSSPSRPGRGAASTGVGRLRSPRTTRSRATRRSLPGQSQEPSMETIGLLRPASPTPTPPLASPQSPHHREDLVQRLILPVAPSLNLAATAHQLYEEAQQAHPPMVPPEIVAGPSTATRTSPRGKRAVSPDSAENPKGHKRSKSSPELDIGHLSRRGGKGNKRGSGGSPTSKKS